MHNLIGYKLKDLLEQHGKSINDLARQTNVSSNTWARVISGSHRLSIDLAIRLGKVFPSFTIITADARVANNGPLSWLRLAHYLDLENAHEQQSDIIFRDIKPFGDKE